MTDQDRRIQWSDLISEKAMGSNPDLPAPVQYSRALDAHAKLLYIELRRLRRKQLPALERDSEFQLLDFKALCRAVGVLPDQVHARMQKMMAPINLIQFHPWDWDDGPPDRFMMLRANGPLTLGQTMLLWPGEWPDMQTHIDIKTLLASSGMPMNRWTKHYDNPASDPWKYLEQMR